MVCTRSLLLALLGLSWALGASSVLAQQAGAPAAPEPPPAPTGVAPASEPASQPPSAVPASTPTPTADLPLPEAPNAPLPEAALQAPAPALPSAAARPAAPAAPLDPYASVRFVENSGRHLTLYERSGDTWRPVCTSPCLFPAPDGPRDYGAPIQNGPTAKYRVAAKSLWLAKGDGLQAEFQERKSIRKAGLCMILGGLAMLAFIPVAAEAPNKTAGLTGLLVPSGAITITGLVMLLLKDRVRLKRCVGCNAALPPGTAPSAPAF